LHIEPICGSAGLGLHRDRNVLLRISTRTRDDRQPMFSIAYRRYALAAVTSIYMLNLVDRGVMGLLVQAIKEDLLLSDTQMGFLTGAAFGLFYATFGLPIARWADRGNRVTISSLSIALWGTTVMACLFVTNYIQLVLARVAAAIGESGCKPPTFSLVGDYFPDPDQRTRAMAVYLAGSPLSTLLSFIVGGWLNERYGWRYTFALIGIPGLILAILVKLTVVEPRTLTVRDRHQERRFPTMKAVLATLWYRRSCRHLSAALILVYTMSLGMWPWFAAFMIRSHGMRTGELGIWLGIIFGAGGIAGTLIGGLIASRWFSDDERGQMRFSAIMMASVVPCFVTFLTVPQKYAALMALAPMMLMLSAFLGPTYVLMQRLVADEMRATIMAAIMLLTNLIGFSIGPQAVGAFSDLLKPVAGTDSLRYAMLAMSFVALWASYHFWQVGQSVKHDLAVVAGNARLGVLTAKRVDARREWIEDGSYK
jgi:MFS family permease